MTRKYGWIPDHYDERDFKYSVAKEQPIQTVYLAHTYKMPAVYDQGDLGSCTGNGVGKIVNYDLINNHSHLTKGFFRPSRLFIYYYERLIEGTVSYDAGAEIRDGIKVIATYGAPSEDLWPYVISKFNVQPPPKAISEGLQFKAVQYRRIDNTNKGLIVNALLEGYPVVFGFTVFSSFESAHATRTGIIPMPKANEQILGGHCMVIVGYNLERDTFSFVNSWGTSWGEGGYGQMPAAYLTNPNLASDFWVVNLIS